MKLSETVPEFQEKKMKLDKTSQKFKILKNQSFRGGNIYHEMKFTVEETETCKKILDVIHKSWILQ